MREGIMDKEKIDASLSSSREAIASLVKVQSAYDEIGWRVSEPAAAK